MISIATRKDLLESHGPVSFEDVMIPDINAIFQATSSDIIIYIEGSRIKILKHPRSDYVGSEIPVSMLRPIIMSGINLNQPNETGLESGLKDYLPEEINLSKPINEKG